MKTLLNYLWIMISQNIPLSLRIHTFFERINIGLRNMFESTYTDIRLEKWVYIERWATIAGKVMIRKWSIIRASARVEDSTIGSDCDIWAEVKRSELGNNVKAKHGNTVILNAKIGDYSNIAAGVIFANYNGISKWKYELGQWVFIGANSVLVRHKDDSTPRRLGDWCFIPNNVSVEYDVPEYARVIRAGEEWETDTRANAYCFIRERSTINLARQSKKLGNV